MSGIRPLIALLLISFAFPALSQAPASTPGKPAGHAEGANVLIDRVGNTGFIQLHAESFHSLDTKQKELAYWLSQASIAVDPIIYDQLSAYGIRQKRLLEEIVAHPQGIDPAKVQKITDFAKVFWANRGNHNDETSQKFLPDFTFDDLQKAAAQAFKNGAFRTPYADQPALTSADAVAK
jgi:dipeptidyl-peptidase III